MGEEGKGNREKSDKMNEESRQDVKGGRTYGGNPKRGRNFKQESR